MLTLSSKPREYSLATFLPSKVTPPPHSHHTLQAGRKSLTTTLTQGEEGREGSSAGPGRKSIYGNYLEFLTRFASSPLVYLYQYGHMDIYFILWVIILHYVIYFVWPLRLWLLSPLSRGLPCPSDMPPSFCLGWVWLGLTLSYFSALQGASGLSCIFLPQPGALASCPRSSYAFSCRMVLDLHAEVTNHFLPTPGISLKS